MTGDEAKIYNLWREVVGDPSFIPDNLDDVWPVQLGSHTESINLDWFERRQGDKVTRRGKVVYHPNYDWAAATLDGWSENRALPVEAKHVGGFEPLSVVLDRYAPQAHWQMFVTGTRQCIFSIIVGAKEPIIEVMDYDDAYGAELWRRAEDFMQYVWDMKPPVTPPSVPPPVKPDRTVDMTFSNSFAAEAITWITTLQAAKDNEAAAKELKKMVPADVLKCFGHGITISRSRAGALIIKQNKE